MARNEMAPWARGPFELIKHADGHLREAGDTDRRIALIGFDNAIEVCIDVFIRLHPKLRGGVELRREDVDNALRNFHTKIEWMDKHVGEKSLEIDFSIDALVWYHSLRNELYHSGNGMVPETHVLEGVRSAALAVFETLFKTDPMPMLGGELPKRDMRNPPVIFPTQNDKMELLRLFFEFERALDTALKALSGDLPARPRSARQMWEEYKSLADTLPTWDAIVQRVVSIRNNIAHGHLEGVKADDAVEACRQLMEVSDGIRRTIVREFENEVRKRGKSAKIDWRESDSPESRRFLFGKFEGVTLTVSPQGLINIPAVRTYPATRYPTPAVAAVSAKELWARQKVQDDADPAKAKTRRTGHLGPIVDPDLRCRNEDCPCHRENPEVRQKRAQGGFNFNTNPNRRS
jgi:hypothetical protein